MSQPPRVLFVLENYWPNIGGVENLFKKLVEKLVAKGYQVTVITTRLSKNDPAVESDGPCRILRYRFRNRYFFTLLALFPVMKHARHCDLVHTTSYNAALPAFLGAKIRGKKIVVTFHEVWAGLWFRLPFMSWWGKRLHWLFEQMLLRLPFDAFAAVSQTTAENLRRAGVPVHQVHTIYNGIDYADFKTDEMTGPAGKPFTYTYFGRLGVSKGLDLLLDAVQQFSQQHPDSRLKLIVPKTPAGFLSNILKTVERHGLQGHVQLLHELPFSDLKKELRASDCVVIPSLSEGFCFAAVECMALDVPLISSGQGALREVVSGRFIEMKTLDAAGLTSALLKARAGQWQETPVQRFELEQTTQGYIELYKRLGIPAT